VINLHLASGLIIAEPEKLRGSCSRAARVGTCLRRAEKTGRRIPPMSERFMSAADFRAALALLHERGVSANELHRINKHSRSLNASPRRRLARARRCTGASGSRPLRARPSSSAAGSANRLFGRARYRPPPRRLSCGWFIRARAIATSFRNSRIVLRGCRSADAILSLSLWRSEIVGELRRIARQSL
jgi:hypothetical protein